MNRSLLARSLAVALCVCASACTPVPEEAKAPAPETALASVAFVHGGAGPWAVLGYRMGIFALRELDLRRQSFDLMVVHHTPHEVQYSCMADGATAATGASVGKLNLELVEATSSGVQTTYQNRATGQSLTLRPKASFVARFRDVPREKLAAAGLEVLQLPDDELFEQVRTRGGS